MNNPEKFHIEMGRRIMQRRKQMNLSQEELSEIADVSPQLMSTAERGAKAIRPENLLKISKALGVSADYLLSGEVIDRDFDNISAKLKNLSPEKIRRIERIIDECIGLCD
ncbi:MAG: helix-turn-helix domain-containing protein [Ruminococcus sp.]|nr:helix-turn-helix domain-containing protein [Ruminococcus sp.]